MNRDEYITNEITNFNKQLTNLERNCLQDRKESRQTLKQDLLENSGYRLFQAIDFMINGDFGAGVYYAIERMMKSPRMNHKAALFNWASALEFNCPISFTCEVWRKLTNNEKEFFNKNLQQIVDDYKSNVPAEV